MEDDLLSSFTTAVGRPESTTQSPKTIGHSQFLGSPTSNSNSSPSYPPSINTDAFSGAFLPPNSPTQSPHGTPNSSPSRTHRKSSPSNMRKVSPGENVLPLSMSNMSLNMSTTSQNSNASDTSNTSNTSLNPLSHHKIELAEEFCDSDDSSLSPGSPTHIKHVLHHEYVIDGIDNQQNNNDHLPQYQSQSHDNTTLLTVDDSELHALMAQTDSLIGDTDTMLSSTNNTTILKYGDDINPNETKTTTTNDMTNTSFNPYDRQVNNASPGLLGETDTQPGMSDSMFLPSKPMPTSNATNATNTNLNLSRISDLSNEEKENHDSLGALGVYSGVPSSKTSSSSASSSAPHPLGMSIVMTNATMSETDPSSDCSIVRGDASKFLFSSQGLGATTSSSSSSSPSSLSNSSSSGYGYGTDSNDGTSVTMKIRLRQDVPGDVVHDVLTTVLLSKGMVVVLKGMDTLRAESKATGRTITSISGVVRESKHRVVCISVHGCTTPYVDLGKYASNGLNGTNGAQPTTATNADHASPTSRPSRGSSFTEVLTSTSNAVVGSVTGVAGSMSGLLLGSTPDHLLGSSMNGSGEDIPLEPSGLDGFTRTLFESLRISFQHQGLTLSAMMQHRSYSDFSQPNTETVSTSSTTSTPSTPSTPSSTTGSTKPRTDSNERDVLVAADYLRQLRDAYRRDMVHELTSYAEPLDKYVHEAEWTCAQFISAMKQIYQKYKIPMPQMPRAPRLTDVILPASRESLPKAWELTTMYGSTAMSTATQAGEHARHAAVLRADKTAHERFARECRVESEMRMSRKQKHVQDRVKRCKDFKSMIIRLLCDSSAATASSWSTKCRALFPNAIASSTASSSSPGSSNQKTEVVLYKSSCMLGSRLGTLWLTYDHLYFHSSILGFTKQKVWSLYDVNAVWKSDGKK